MTKLTYTASKNLQRAALVAILTGSLPAHAYFTVEGMAKVEPAPVTDGGEAYQVVVNTSYPAVIDRTPRPAGTTVDVVKGFADHVPLQVGIAMAIPEHWSSQIHPRIGPDQLISWRGDKPWPQVAKEIAEQVQAVAFIDWERHEVTFDPMPDGVLNPGGAVPGSSGGMKDVSPGAIPLLTDQGSKVEARPVPNYGTNTVAQLPGVNPAAPTGRTGLVTTPAGVAPIASTDSGNVVERPKPITPGKGGQTLADYEQKRSAEDKRKADAISARSSADSFKTVAVMPPAHRPPPRIYSSVQDFYNERIQVDVARVPVAQVLRALVPDGWVIDSSNIDETTLSTLVSLTAVDARGLVMESLARPLALVMYPYPDLNKLIVAHRR